MIQLTEHQHQCVEMASKGHNFTIYGQAGTGKSRVVENICLTLRKAGKKSQVVCSTGIACEVFKEKKIHGPLPITIHSFLGIKTAEGSFQSVIESAVDNDIVVKRIRETDCCIWDECSMGSARLLELFHVIASKGRGDSRPFGGMQVILVGDWLQLKPVPGKYDQGRQMFYSPLFTKLIPHTIELDVIYRQDSSEEEFLAVLQDIRKGWCNAGTAQAIRRLARPFPHQYGKEVVHLFYKNLYVDTHNSMELTKLRGERVQFTGKEEGDVTGLKYPSPKVLYCKEGAPVICTYNVNSKIHNGTRGYFISKTSSGEAVIDVDGAQYTIKEVTWYNKNDEGKVVGSFRQVPLKLNWASTVHKAQGLQLPAICIHSSYEFTGGLIYTAMTRVRSINDIQVLDFDPRHVLNRDDEIQEVRRVVSFNDFGDDHGNCCAQMIEPVQTCSDADNPVPMVSENEGQYITDDNAVPSDDIADQEDENYIRADLFEEVIQPEQGNMNDYMEVLNASIIDVLETLSTGENLCQPPADFDYKQFFECLIDRSVMRLGVLTAKRNELIGLAIQELEYAASIVRHAWIKVYGLIKDRLPENKEETRFTTNTTKNWYAKSMLIMKESLEFRVLARKFLDSIQHKETGGVVEFSVGEYSLMRNIVNAVFQNLLRILAGIVADVNREAHSSFNVDDMDEQGKGKIRFIGGWVTSRLLKSSRRYISSNMNTNDKVVMGKVKNEITKLMVLENCLVVPYDILSRETRYPETLKVTEERQYRTHGLIHISDEFYEFCIILEKERLQYLTTNMWQRHGDDVVQVAKMAMENSPMLLEAWNKLLMDKKIEEATKEQLFKAVITRYLNVGTKQFLRDFRHHHSVKKTTAHRQMVLMRKEKRETKAAKVSIEQAYEDRSRGKSFTHQKLQAFLTKYGKSAFCNIYTRAELNVLCAAYGTECKTRMKKGEVAEKLAAKIGRVHCIPYPYLLLDSRCTRIEPSVTANGNESQSLTLRIVWAPNVLSPTSDVVPHAILAQQVIRKEIY